MTSCSQQTRSTCYFQFHRAHSMAALRNARSWVQSQALGPVFPVSQRIPCVLIQACAFMSEEPEQALSILMECRCWSGMGVLGGWEGLPGWEARAASLVCVYMLSRVQLRGIPTLLPHPRL